MTFLQKKDKSRRINHIYLSDNSIKQVGMFSGSFFENPSSQDMRDVDTISDEAKQYLIDSNYYFKDGFHYFDITPSEIKRSINKEKRPVVYKLNSNFFRCDQFIKDHDGKHVLFAGCSETFGEGGNIENNWSYKLYEYLSQTNKLSGYFNIGKPGACWDDVMLLTKGYIARYGKPDVLFILAPNLIRNYTYVMGKWEINVMNQPFKKNDEYFKLYGDKFVSWVNSLHNFIEHLNLMNIKVVWSTWATQENINITRTGFFDNSFCPTWDIVHDGINIENLTPEDTARRDGHAGNLYHSYIANEMVNFSCKKEYFNLPNKVDDVPINLDKVFNE